MARWDDALEAERRLGIDFVGARDRRRVRGDEITEGLFSSSMFAAHARSNFRRGRLSSKASSRCSTVMNSMPLLARLHESHVEADFEFLRNHLSSTVLIGAARLLP